MTQDPWKSQLNLNYYNIHIIEFLFYPGEKKCIHYCFKCNQRSNKQIIASFLDHPFRLELLPG